MKDFNYRIIKEDAKLDQKYRLEACNIVNDFVGFIWYTLTPKHKQELRKTINMTMDVSQQIEYAATAVSELESAMIKLTDEMDDKNVVCFLTQIDTKYENYPYLNFLFSDKIDSIPDISAFDKETSTIIITLLRNGRITLDTVKRVLEMSTKLKHEVMHFLDSIYHNGKDVKTQSYQQGNTEQNRKYYNSEKEFNAWCQEILFWIEDFMMKPYPKPKKTRKQMTDEGFVHNFINEYFLDKEMAYKLNDDRLFDFCCFIEQLDERNRHRLIQRIVNYFQDIWAKDIETVDKEITQEEAVSELAKQALKNIKKEKRLTRDELKEYNRIWQKELMSRLVPIADNI